MAHAIDRLNTDFKALATSEFSSIEELDLYEEELTDTIYRFAENEGEWFNLLLGISSCLSLASELPNSHPVSELSHRLLQHLRAALKLSMQLEMGEQEVAQFRFNQVPIAVGLVSGLGQIIGMNQQAQSLIKQARELTINEGIVFFNDKPLTSLMVGHDDHNEQRIRSKNKRLAFKSGADTSQNIDYFEKLVAIPLVMENGEGGILHMTELATNDDADSPSILDNEFAQTAYYFSIVPDQEAPLNLELLRGAYQLTKTETQILGVLIRESSVAGVAAYLKLQPATVRDHLSNIYQKLGVNRKPDLIRKVLMESIISSPLVFSPHDNKSEGAEELSDEELDASFPRLLRLPDGRNIAYRDLHPEKNDKSLQIRRNVLVLHNVMGSCYETPPDGERYAREHNIRLIIPDRPGYGQSDPLPEPDFQQWSQDIQYLLDELGLERVHVLGHSLGGSYSMAFAEMSPERVIGIALVSPVPRVQDMRNVEKMPILLRASLQTIRHAPFLIEPMVKMLLGKDLEKFYRKQLNFVRPQLEGRPGDLALIAQSFFHIYSMKNFRRSLMQGSAIWASELKHGFSEWDFSLQNKAVPYQLWHGTSDDVVTIEMVENLAKDIQVSQFHRLQNETHLLFHRNFNEILSELISIE